MSSSKFSLSRNIFSQILKEFILNSFNYYNKKNISGSNWLKTSFTIFPFIDKNVGMSLRKLESYFKAPSCKH